MMTCEISSSTGRFDGRALASHARVVVRHAEPGDSEGLHAIFTDPDVMNWLVEVPYVPAAHTRKQVEESVSGRYMLVASGGERIVGALGLGSYPSPRLRHVGRIGPIAVSRSAQGLGVGSSLMRAALDLADNWLNLVRLELLVFTTNDPAVALYRKFGFEVEGTARAFGFQAGRYVDVHLMARVRLPGS
ncbi:MAG: GNAT family N-acetyltransferase [Burkholderiales bacterium]|nr:GNAT family N-acetyltransferase [Burkholderiales bacterium]